MNSGVLSGVIIKEIGCGREPMQSDMKIVDLDLSWFNCLPPLISATRLRIVPPAYAIPSPPAVQSFPFSDSC